MRWGASGLAEAVALLAAGRALTSSRPARRGALGRAPQPRVPGLNEKNSTPTQVTDMKHAQPEREPIPWPADGAEAPQGLE
jgi:hypothetical protein